MLWYSALVRWRHNRRPRNYRFIQWGWKTDAKKRHFPNEFRKTFWQDFNWVIEDYFSLLLLRFERHAFFDRSAALMHWGTKVLILNIKRCSLILRDSAVPQCDQWNADNWGCDESDQAGSTLPAPPSKSLVFQVDNTAQTDRISSSLCRELGYFALGF